MPQRKNPLDRYLNTLGEGKVEWIGLRPQSSRATAGSAASGGGP